MPEGQPIRARTALLRHVAAPAAVIALLAGHGIILRIVAAHTSLSLAVVVALGGVIAIKHRGLLGLYYGALRRGRRNG